MTSGGSIATTLSADHVRLAGLDVDRLTEAEVVRRVITRSQAGEGGWIVPVNVDVCRQLRDDSEARALVAKASLIVPDGMPLVWAARLKGQPVPERVAGSALVFSLSEAAAEAGRSIYLLGGAAGVPEAAAVELADRYPGLKVAGTDSPPFGFERSAAEVAAIRERLCQAAPDIVYVGLGFPKQEKLISGLRPVLPTTWFISCGAAIGFAAGAQKLAPDWMRRSGLEWTHRLLSEPRRLYRRYLVHDLPYAASLLCSAAAARVTHQ